MDFAQKILLLGSGELGKETAIEAQRLGVALAWDRDVQRAKKRCRNGGALHRTQDEELRVALPVIWEEKASPLGFSFTFSLGFLFNL